MVRREDMVRAVADAVVAVPGVAALSPGPGVEVSTQFAGGKVVGVRMNSDRVEIHVVANQVPLAPVGSEVVAAVRRVLAAMGDPRPVEVTVDDLVGDTLDRRAA